LELCRILEGKAKDRLVAGLVNREVKAFLEELDLVEVFAAGLGVGVEVDS